jgi:hypothetical protein
MLDGQGVGNRFRRTGGKVGQEKVGVGGIGGDTEPLKRRRQLPGPLFEQVDALPDCVQMLSGGECRRLARRR